MVDWESLAEDFGNLPTTRARVTIIDGELWDFAAGGCDGHLKAGRWFSELSDECDSRPNGWAIRLWERFPKRFRLDDCGAVTKDSEGRWLEFRTVDDVGRLSQRLARELAKAEADTPVVDAVEAEEPTREASRITSPTELRKLLGIGEQEMAQTTLTSRFKEGTLTKVPGGTTKRFCLYLDSPALTQYAVDKLRDRNSS